MESTPEEKFSSIFSILLCVYFVLLFRTIIGGIPELFNSIIPDILRQSHPSGWALFYLVYYLLVLYGFWAVILSLRKSKSAIPALKLALPFSLISFIVSTITKLKSVNNLALAIVAFYIGFLIYISKSKEIEELFPRHERRFGTPGFVGVALYTLIGILVIIPICDAFAKRSFGKDVSPSSLVIRPGEVTDGRTIFTPDAAWEQDSTATIEKFRNIYYYHDGDSSKITVFSCLEEYKPTRDTYIYSIYEDQPLGVEYYRDEIDHKFFEAEDDIIYYIDQYRYEKDSTSYYWTYASKLDGKLMKGIRISILEKDSLRISIPEVERILGNCLLSTRERSLKKHRVNQVNNPNKKDKESDPPPGTSQK